MLLLAGLLYLGIALVYTWPLLRWWNQAIPANSIGQLDGWQHTWHLWWTASALAQGQNPYFTPMLFYPDGISMFNQTLNAPTGVLMAPVTLTAGPIAAYNLAVLLSFVLGGLFTYLLTYHLTRHHIASIAAGGLFVLAPFHFGRLLDGQLEHTSIQWLPLYMYLLVRTAEHGGNIRIGVLALCLVFITLSSWYYGVYLALLSVIYALLVWQQQGRQAFLRLVGAGVLSLLLLLPLVLPMLTYDPDWRHTYRQSVHSADLLGFLLPPPFHPLWGWPWGWLIRPEMGDWLSSIGWSSLALALIGLRACWRQSWRWGVLLVSSLVFALGPVLIVGGYETGIPMPYAILNVIPGLREAQRPIYWLALSSLLLSVLAAYGLRALWQTWATRLLAVGCLVFALVEFYPGPLPYDVYQPHPFFASLSEQPREALLELPQIWWSSAGMRDQMLHEWPIAGGYVSRRRDNSYPFMQQAPGIQAIWDHEDFQSDIVQPTERSQVLEALDAAGLRYVVLRRTIGPEWIREENEKQLAEVFGQQAPAVDDEELLVYRVPRHTSLPVLVAVADGWYEREKQDERRWRWIEDRAAIALINPGEDTRHVLLSIAMSAHQTAQPLQVFLDERHLGSFQVEADFLRTYRLDVALPPGRHQVFLVPSEHHPAADGRRLSIMVTGVRLTQ